MPSASRTTSSRSAKIPRWLAILLVCMAGLLLEVGYTRIVSYKLWYYYTYLVIGLSLLGIGSGGVFVAVSSKLRSWTTERVIAVCSVVGAISIGIGYLIIARIPIDTFAIWRYGTGASFRNLAALGVICLVLFSTFIALGIIISVLLGRAGPDIGKLYFADLIGAGAGCLLAIPLISRLGPPAVVALAALIFALVGVLAAAPRSRLFVLGCLAVVATGAGVVAGDALPAVRVEETKLDGQGAEFSEWGPVFRVDVLNVGDDDMRLLGHDGTFGSGIHRFDGDVDALDDYDAQPRTIPFEVLGEPPERELIIGSAGGNEILASLAHGADDIEAVELNPVTVGLLKDEYAEFTGNLPDRPEVDMTLGDGRSYLARSESSYDLVWYVAPDSYAANNAASSGAMVLSESYLYTTEMIQTTLEHLTDDGIMVVQFGELELVDAPNRTGRYVVTARDALEAVGVENPSEHLLVSGSYTPPEPVAEGEAPAELTGGLSTILVKRTPFTDEERAAFVDAVELDEWAFSLHPLEAGMEPNLPARLAAGSGSDVASIVGDHPDDISAVRDNAPFFWHFARFGDVLADMSEPIETAIVDPEDAVGERVLLLLLGFAIVYAFVFLLLPFVAVRKRWSSMPAKGISMVYFSALGLGFMLFEISMIQRLSRFLGYPTYSLTVTLASILVFTGVGALLSKRLSGRERRAMPIVVGLLAVLTAFYQFGLDGLTDGLLDTPLSVRVVVALAVLAPLGLLLGMFMPLGLSQASRLGGGSEEYVAWAWAVNGFFSVIGSVLTTILAMTFGFRAVQLGALALYVLAGLAFLKLAASARSGPPPEASVDAPVLVPTGGS